MGELPGKAILNINGNSLSGMLSLLNHDNSFSGESIDDGKIVFKDELKKRSAVCPTPLQALYWKERSKPLQKPRWASF